MMADTHVKIEPLLYKFIRCCLNRAYAMLDDSQLSAEERYSLETLLQRVRSSEDSWKDIEDLIRFIKGEFLTIYEDGLKRLPKELVRELFIKTVDLCLQLPEVYTRENIKEAFLEVRKKIEEIYEKLKQET